MAWPEPCCVPGLDTDYTSKSRIPHLGRVLITCQTRRKSTTPSVSRHCRPPVACSSQPSSAFPLLVEQKCGWKSSQNFVQTVSNNRATVAIMVKLLSYTLGLIHIFSICTLHSSEARSLLILITEIGSALALSFRYEARIRSFPLDSVKFMNAAYALRLDKTLSWPFFSALVVLIGFSLVPASIWAGAITPIVVDNNNLSRTIDVPSLAHSTILADGGIFLNS